MDRAQRIKAERERLGYTQAAFADASGVARRSQILYEQGRPPSADYLEAVAALGMDILYVVTGQRAPDNVLSDLDRLTAAIEAVELALDGSATPVPAARRARMIAAAYDLMRDTTPATKATIARLLAAE